MKVPLRERIRYAFDNTLSHGTAALIAWLALASAVLVLVASLFVWLLGAAPQKGFISLLWTILLHTLGRSIPSGEGASWAYLLPMLVVSLASIFVTGTLIALLSAVVRNKADDLREGRSKVIETGHTVILGWAPHIFSIIRELVVAKANEPDSCIVVLGDEDKVQMENDIHDKVGRSGHTRIVCRRGNPTEPSDLEIAGVHTSRAVIILSPDEDEPDSSVIKSLLAVTNSPQRRSDPYHIVAEIHKPENMSVARIVGRNEAELVLAGDLIARITAQACRQPGLSIVYTELLNFEGDEIYFKVEPELTGKTFGDALLAYEDSTPIGLQPRGGSPQLCPGMDTVIHNGDQIIAIAKDQNAIRLSGRHDLNIRTDAMQAPQRAERQPERTLLLGWNWYGSSLIRELDRYVAPRSRMTVVADVAAAESEVKRCRSDLENQKVKFRIGNTAHRPTLDKLAIHKYDHVIILSYSDTLDRQQADARTLATLLHLRDIAERSGHPFSIVSEMLDVRNRNLAEVTRADDFIVSEQLTSLMLAQICERKELNAVFSDLLNPEGADIHLGAATEYVKPGEPVGFYTVVDAARQRGEVALGYHLQAYASDAGKAYGVVLNPNKSEPVSFMDKDRIIVLA
jgi:voltage-gated potassium channel Kch